MIGDEDDESAPIPSLTRVSLTLSALAVASALVAYLAFVTGLSGSPGGVPIILFPFGAIAASGCAVVAFVLAVAAVVRSRGFGRAHSATHAALFLSILLLVPAVTVGGPFVSEIGGRLWQESAGESLTYAETVEAEYTAQLDEYTVLLEPLVDSAIAAVDGSIPEDAAEQNTGLDVCDGGRWVTFAADVDDARRDDAEKIVEVSEAAGLTFMHRSGGEVESWTYVRSSTSPYPLVEAVITRTPTDDGEELTVSLISSCVGDGL